MKIYTIEDLETFERDKIGRLICPSGDYSAIKSFGERCSFGECCSFGAGCSFGECCSFGERCSFGKWCSFGESCLLENHHHFENIAEEVDRVVKIDRIGSRKDCTYFFKALSETYVRCGCFFGTLEDFEKQVNKTHKDNEQYRTEYMEAIKYIKAIM